MRLIDADKLMKDLKRLPIPEDRRGDRGNVYDVIEEEPAVEAIPISYIDALAWKYRHDENVRSREPEWANALDALIDCWEKDHDRYHEN